MKLSRFELLGILEERSRNLRSSVFALSYEHVATLRDVVEELDELLADPKDSKKKGAVSVVED